jgi:pilus assembly protein Flp/PilA
MFSVRHSWAPRTNGGRCAALYRRLSLYCLIEDRSGATAIEYGLIAALVSIAGITALDLLGGSLIDIFDLVTSALVDPRCIEVGSSCNQ